MNAANSLRAEMLRAAVSMIGTDQIAWPLTVQLVCPCGVAVQHFTEEQWRALQEAPDTVPLAVPDVVPDVSEMPPMMADALEASDAQWRVSADLAQRAGWTYGGRWRGVVCALVRAGLLTRDRKNRLKRTDADPGRPAEHGSD